MLHDAPTRFSLARSGQLTRRLGALVAFLAASGCVGELSTNNPGPGGGPPPPGAGPRPPGTTPPPGPAPPGLTPPGSTPPPAPPGTPPPAACTVPPARVWALTPEQYIRTVKSVLPNAVVSGELGGTAGGRHGFSNEASRLSLTEPQLGQLLELAYGLADAAAAQPGGPGAVSGTGAAHRRLRA